MVCCACIVCSGSGFLATFLGFIISVTFFSHLFGLVTPFWMCDNIAGDTCDTHGLFLECEDDAGYDTGATDDTVVGLALIVTISSFILNIVYCGILHCTSYSHKPLSLGLAIFIGGWFIIQEIGTIATLAVVGAKFDKIGWAALVFSIPGIVCMVFVILIIIYLFYTRDKVRSS